MEAIVVDRFGGPDELQIRTTARPSPRPHEPLVKVVAAGVNPVDARIRRDGTWAGVEVPFTPGSDVSGIVVEMGDEVEGASFSVTRFTTSRIIWAPETDRMPNIKPLMLHSSPTSQRRLSHSRRPRSHLLPGPHTSLLCSASRSNRESVYSLSGWQAVSAPSPCSSPHFAGWKSWQSHAGNITAFSASSVRRS